MENEVFLDTAYAIALANVHDQFHEKAITIARQLRIHQTKLITTRAVLFEIGNALSGQRFRSAAVKLLDSLLPSFSEFCHELHKLSQNCSLFVKIRAIS